MGTETIMIICYKLFLFYKKLDNPWWGRKLSLYKSIALLKYKKLDNPWWGRKHELHKTKKFVIR